MVLPHEDVMPGPVDDRTVLMRTTRDEPGADPAGPRGLRPAPGPDRQGRHRSTGRGLHRPRRQPAPALGGHRRRAARARSRRSWPRTQALIADGHHRYAAYLRLQDELRDPAAAAGDVTVGPRAGAARRPGATTPCTSGRSTAPSAALTMSDLQDVSADRGDALPGHPDREAASPPRTPGTPTRTRAWFVVSDGRGLGRRRDPADPARSTPRCCTRCCCPPGGWPRSRSATTTASTRRCTPRRGSPASWSPSAARRVAEVMATAARRHADATQVHVVRPQARMGVVMRDLATTP